MYLAFKKKILYLILQDKICKNGFLDIYLSLNQNVINYFQLDEDKFIQKASKMFNTFSSHGKEVTFANQNKFQLKQKIVQLNNLSTIQLNPWNDQNNKSPLYFETEGFPSFPKPALKPSSGIKYSLPRQGAKKGESRTILYRRKFDANILPNNQISLYKRRSRFPSDSSYLQRMNKTISVHNFEGQKMLGQNQSFDRKQKIIEKQQKRHRTTISNPMYGKFCNNYNNQKIHLSKRKKMHSDIGSVKFENLMIKQSQNRNKMSSFSINKGDPERAQSIHEVRKRLKSTTEMMRKNKEENQIKINQNTQWALNGNGNDTFRQKQNIKLIDYFKIGHIQDINPSLQVHNIRPQQQSEKFKLGRRKNLYIGYRKFFNPCLGLKQRSMTKKQFQSNNIVNLNALVQHGQVDILRKFQTLEQYAYQKSYKNNY